MHVHDLMRIPIVAAAATLLFSGTVHAQEVADSPDSSSMRSGAVFGFGMGMMTVGAAGVVAGAAGYASISSCDDLRTMSAGDITRDHLESCESEPFQKVGAIVGMATGGALFLVGLPLSIFGGSSHPDEVASEKRKVTASVGPTGGSLSLTF